LLVADSTEIDYADLCELAESDVQASMEEKVVQVHLLVDKKRVVAAERLDSEGILFVSFVDFMRELNVIVLCLGFFQAEVAFLVLEPEFCGAAVTIDTVSEFLGFGLDDFSKDVLEVFVLGQIFCNHIFNFTNGFLVVVLFGVFGKYEMIH
jgi:hypothetical protein